MNSGLKDENYKVRILRCPESGVVCSEEWETAGGVLHRLDGPAVVRRSPVSGLVTHIGYWVEGRAHRSDGEPAIEEFNGETGASVWRAFSVNGQYSRDNDRPHCEFVDKETGLINREEYRLWTGTEAVLHRTTGPALLTYDPITGLLTGSHFYYKGRRRHQSESFDATPS